MTKKIIDGKRYDTETAQEIASWSNGLGSSDFRNCDETLYRTKNGKWFTCGSGGPLSAYSRPAEGGGYCGSNNVIRPLSTSEALEWLERHDETDAIEEHFADAVKDA